MIKKLLRCRFKYNFQAWTFFKFVSSLSYQKWYNDFFDYASWLIRLLLQLLLVLLCCFVRTLYDSVEQRPPARPQFLVSIRSRYYSYVLSQHLKNIIANTKNISHNRKIVYRSFSNKGKILDVVVLSEFLFYTHFLIFLTRCVWICIWFCVPLCADKWEDSFAIEWIFECRQIGFADL